MPRPEWPANYVPAIEIAIEPKSPAHLGKLRAALELLAGEDPDFRMKIDEESGQTILGGTGELHLDVIIDRLKNEFGVGFNVGAPQVAYREAITRVVDHDYTHKRQLDYKARRPAQFARIKFRIEPNKPGGGFAFLTVVPAGNLPAEYIAAVRTGVESVMGAGPAIGFPIVDVAFALTDGACHDIDSSALAFEAAGRAGFKEAIEKAGPKILEPIMTVDLTVPWECAGDVIAELKKRRAVIRSTDGVGSSYAITALVPLANMFGYINSLRSLTGGRGQFSMRFDHYAQVPDPVQPDDGPFGGAMAMRA